MEIWWDICNVIATNMKIFSDSLTVCCVKTFHRTKDAIFHSCVRLPECITWEHFPAMFDDTVSGPKIVELLNLLQAVTTLWQPLQIWSARQWLGRIPQATWMIRDLCVMLEYIPCTYGIICVYYVHIFMCSFFVIMYVILLNYSFMCFF
jgi:hypothetical protein